MSETPLTCAKCGAPVSHFTFRGQPLCLSDECLRYVSDYFIAKSRAPLDPHDDSFDPIMLELMEEAGKSHPEPVEIKPRHMGRIETDAILLTNTRPVLSNLRRIISEFTPSLDTFGIIPYYLHETEGSLFDDRLIITDGNHRTLAALILGVESVPAYALTREEFLHVAHHTKGLTVPIYPRAVETPSYCLGSEEWKDTVVLHIPVDKEQQEAERELCNMDKACQTLHTGKVAQNAGS